MQVDWFVVQIYNGQNGGLFGVPEVYIGFLHLLEVGFSLLMIPIITVAAVVMLKMRGKSKTVMRFDD